MDWSSIASGVGGLVGAVAGIFANEETNKANQRNVNQTNKYNKTIAAQNNATQIQMVRENNQFAHDEAELARQWNSPIEMAKRFEEAGINPSVAFSGELSNTSSISAQPSQSGISPSLPTMIPFQKQSPFNIAVGLGSDVMLKSAQALEAISKSKQSAAEAKQISGMLKSNIEKLQVETEGQKLANFIMANFGAEKEKAQLALLAQQATTLAQQGKKDEAEARLTESQDYLNKQLASYHGQNAALLKQRNETYMTELKATINQLQELDNVHYATFLLYELVQKKEQQKLEKLQLKH